MNNAGIRYWNRYTQSVEIEKVYGEEWIRAGYGTGMGRWLLSKSLTRPWLSHLYGWFQDRPSSANKIPVFIEKYQINMNEFEPGPFKNFNSFFIRAFKQGKRPFPTDPKKMGACAEGRYIGLDHCHSDTRIPVKGAYLNPVDFIAHSRWAQSFLGGPCLVARLCPVDYHRYHFPDSGQVLETYRRHGPLHSVNPAAFGSFPEALIQNERQVSILKTENFGMIAMIEVGALCVGKMVQTHSDRFNRGEQKGYFLFGASTVVILGEPGRWAVDPEIVTQTNQGSETYIRLGDTVSQSRT